MTTDAYRPARPAAARTLAVRGLAYHLNVWGDPDAATTQHPLLLMLHGWMDLGASFQFVVDALAAHEGAARCIVAPDWRGFGRSAAPGTDSYWFPDYLGDLDAIGDALSPTHPFDLLGHSMGGNVVMGYAAVRPQRVRRLVNLEGFGLPATRPEEAGARIAQWLDELRQPQRLSGYDSLEAVAARLRRNNPRLPEVRARWLAAQWAAPDAAGRWQLRADAAHKRVNPVLYRVDETLALWQAIRAPLLWVEGEHTDLAQWWGARYSHAEFEQRLAVVPQVERVRLADAGHMLHHDQPEALAEALARFLT
ncbi:MAG TPA: alpha/beta hydrolase [Burkholderiaceae bacterium]|nr:alpha/beta hydrolase [Burkholderiaceae bacterium]